MRVVGFTGTRKGMTPRQIELVAELLAQYKRDGAEEFHHGDCVGADAQAYELAKRLGYRTVAHPPVDPVAQAYTVNDETRQARDYLARDHEIVHEAHVIIAASRTAHELLRSGTWATVRYARKVGKPVHVVIPETASTSNP